jgi:hypothetical protein
VLEDFDDTPPLELAQRAGFHDADEVARLRLAFLIVGVKTF